MENRSCCNGRQTCYHDGEPLWKIGLYHQLRFLLEFRYRKPSVLLRLDLLFFLQDRFELAVLLWHLIQVQTYFRYNLTK